MAINSYIETLEQQLQILEERMVQFLNNSTIQKSYKDPFEEENFLPASDYSWGEDDESQKRRQLELLKFYSSWFEHLRLLFQDASKNVQKQIADTDQSIKTWIEKENNGWNVPPTIEEAKSNFKRAIQPYYQLLRIFRNPHKAEVILVPDTNALLTCMDLSQYKDIAERDAFTVVFVPTVLGELDKLTRDHRDQNFRNKVDKVIRYIKGLRQQGNIREGVTVHKTIIVKMVAQDPNFEKTLGWLNPTNADDCIMASTLEIQRSEPSDIVILVTSDIKHQNKAEMANLPYVEPPKLPEPAEF